jgi:biotin operon repressor
MSMLENSGVKWHQEANKGYKMAKRKKLLQIQILYLPAWK